MRPTLLIVGLFASIAAANIKFTWVNPTCTFAQHDDTRCLTGQHCAEGNLYVVLASP
jgi:hypothetical protein